MIEFALQNIWYVNKIITPIHCLTTIIHDPYINNDTSDTSDTESVVNVDM